MIEGRIKRHDLGRAEIIADIYVDGVLVLEDENLIGEGAQNFDVTASGGPADLRARVSRRAKATPEWRKANAARIAANHPLTFGIGGILP